MQKSCVVLPLIPLVLGILLFLCEPATAADNETALQLPLDAHLSKTESNVQTDDLPAMMTQRYIRVLTAMNRTNFFLAGPEIHGFEYALLKEYEHFLNQGLKPPALKIVLEFLPVPRDKLFSDLVAGHGDIAAAGLTITPGRAESVAFTRPYLTEVDELLVTHKDVKAPADPMGLSGKKVFVRKSSSYYESLMALNLELQKAGKPAVRIIPADENLETEDILEMVNCGAVQRTVCDSHIAHIWEKVLHGITVHETVKLRQGAQIAWAVRKTNPLLKKSLNTFLRDHRKGTLLGNILFERYYRENTWIMNPLSGDAAQKIENYRPFFKKYAGLYGFDWHLILAMAFQESALNHQRKSHRGAVGLMQIRPSTAADPNVGIKNIHGIENNIHAAIKYLDFIRKRYFNGEDIRPRDQVRFALAAYNAGPARIRTARAKAKKMDLNPNRWFRNVELVVLTTVGQETVQYVSNINKYYVIYKNALAVAKARSNLLEDIR